jgi:hypothetical protein
MTLSSAQSDAPVVPPINFSLVVPGVYRSGHPNKKNFGFLRTLSLRGIMCVYSALSTFPNTHLKLTLVSGRYVVGDDEYRKDSLDFVNNENIELYRFNLSKEAVSRSRPRPSLALCAVGPS